MFLSADRLGISCLFRLAALIAIGATAPEALADPGEQETVETAARALRDGISELEVQTTKTGTAEMKAAIERVNDASRLVVKQAEQLADDADRSQEVVDQLKSAKLIERGITGGLAVLSLFPLTRSMRTFDNRRGYMESGAEVVPTPYVMVLPFYWNTSRPEQSKYCASRFTLSSVAAQRAADAMARERAVEIVDQMIRAYRVSRGKDALEALRTVPALQAKLNEDLESLQRRLDRAERKSQRIGEEHVFASRALATATTALERAATQLKDARSEHAEAYKTWKASKTQAARGELDKRAKAFRDAKSTHIKAANEEADQRTLVESLTAKRDAADLVRALEARRLLAAAEEADGQLQVPLWALEVASSTTTSGGGAAKEARAQLTDWAADKVLGWATGVRAGCFWYGWGVWATLPPFTSYDVSLRWEDDMGGVDVSRRPVKRWVSFGLGYAPSAYISVLGGVSYNTLDVERANDDGSVTLERSMRFWSWTMGLALNIDLATAAL